MSARDLRVAGPIDLLDEASRTVRSLGVGAAVRAWLSGAIPAFAFIVLFYFERVESIRNLRFTFAFVLVLAWCVRALLLRGVAAQGVRLIAPELPQTRQSVGSTLLAAIIFGMGLWCWLWLLVLVSLAEPQLAFLMIPFLAGRAAVAPSWLARAGTVDESGISTWLKGMSDTAKQRATGIVAEFLLMLGALGLFLNLFLLLRFLVYAGRAYFGFDLALMESFLSGDNSFVMLALASFTLVLLEPYRAALSASHFVGARARTEGLDLTTSIDAAVQHTTQKTGFGRAAAALLALSIVSSSLMAHAQDAPGKTFPHDAEARTHAAEILQRAEYREFIDAQRGQGADDESWWSRLMRWLNDKDNTSTSTGAGGAASGMGLPGAQVFIILGVVLLLVVLLSLFLSREKPAEDQATNAPVEGAMDIREKAPTVFLDEAAMLASQGLYREALRSLYLATLVALDRKRVIVFDSHLTNWQYLRQMPRNALRDAFSQFTRVFDFKWYGHEPATLDDYNRCRQLADFICAPSEAAA